MLIIETVLIWLAAIILAIVAAPIILVLSVLFVLFAFFLSTLTFAATFVVAVTVIQVLVWPFRKLYDLFS